MSTANSLKSIVFSLIANVAIASVKLFAALFTHSGAMLAEAIHSFADCSNQLLLMWGMKRAARAPDADHPMGYGKEMYFWSFIVALLLFSMGGVFSVYEGWHRFHSEEPIENPLLAIGILLFSLVLEGFSLWACLKEINLEREHRSVLQWAKESRTSELLVLFGENGAALIGLSIALLAIVATLITHNPIYDAIGTMAIGVLLIVVALFVGVQTKRLLVGKSMDPVVLDDLERFIRQQPEIKQVHKIITIQFGSDVMVALKAQLIDSAQTQGEIIAMINGAETQIKSAFPAVKWIFFELDSEA